MADHTSYPLSYFAYLSLLSISTSKTTSSEKMKLTPFFLCYTVLLTTLLRHTMGFSTFRDIDFFSSLWTSQGQKPCAGVTCDFQRHSGIPGYNNRCLFTSEVQSNKSSSDNLDVEMNSRWHPLTKVQKVLLDLTPAASLLFQYLIGLVSSNFHISTCPACLLTA